MRWGFAIGGLVVLGAALGVGVLWARQQKPSVCRGTPANGSLQHGWKLPRSGPNFRAYSDVGWMAGRTYVHSSVHRVVLQAYERMARDAPAAKLVYGETGWQEGGEIPPHRTHRNGLSVDFMVPLLDDEGRPMEIPTSASNRYGYDVELDAEGRAEGMRIDFESLAVHLAALDRSARDLGIGISKVIFDPKLVKKLRETRRWGEISRLPFSTKPAWVRHDEHYHLDFAVKCAQ